MGERIRPSFRLNVSRTALAALLTAVAVALPSGTWLFAGSRQVAREAQLEEDNVYSQASKKGVELAERLSAQLGVLRDREASRPFYEYQTLYHDPRGVAEGTAISLSPLAQGPVHPYVLSHFQVDAEGRLNLPSKSERFPELGWHGDGDAPVALLEKLEDVASFCIRGYDPSTSCPTSAAPTVNGERNAERGEPATRLHVEELTSEAWHQHLLASELYGDLKQHRKVRRAIGGGAASVNGDGDDSKVLIVVGDLDWYTLPVANDPGLVALRSVDTPVGTWTQGFVIFQQAIGDYLEDAYYPARFLPLDAGREKREEEIVVPVEGTPWGVSLDLSAALAEVAAEAERDRGRFLLVVLLSTLAAALSGLMVVALVRQSEQLAAQRAQFAASAAHELRTPLAGLRLYSEMLAEGLGDPSRAQRYASRVAGEAARLARVVTNVLSFTRLERRMLTVDPQPGDLGAAVRELVERNRAAFVEAGMEVELAIEPDLPPARFDRDALAHIVQNLLDNAEKYSRDVEGRKVRVALGMRGDALELEVADNGPGIPTAFQRKLFQPFTRADNEDGVQGLGLGLVLVQALARAQGGDIRYHAAAAGGAAFTVRVPC